MLRPAAVTGAAAVAAITLVVIWTRAGAEDAMVATVSRGELVAKLTSTGTLKPIQSITYRSPIPGRDTEIRDLAPEGSLVAAGDLLVKLDTTDLELELARVRQEHRQAQIDLQVAEGEFDEAGAEVKAVTEGEGALTVEEARSALQRAQKKAERLRTEFEHLKPLLEKGFITRDELARTEDQLEEAEEELILARRRTDVVVELSHPREQKRAALALAQKTSQLGHARTRAAETEMRLDMLERLIEGCTIRARGPGLVVYEENLNSNPRRKLRIGDRVFATQGIVTIPEVNRMLVEASISESEVHRVKTGQAAEVRGRGVSRSEADRQGHAGRHPRECVREPALRRQALRPDHHARSDDRRPAARDDDSRRRHRRVRTGVLMIPVTAVFNNQGSRVAYVAGATGVEMRTIDLGESNDRMVEIVSGLREGERVSLSAPAAAGQAASPRGNALQPR